MRFLVFGLGSMGKRRIRCLQSLGYNDIIGFDIREDRRKEASDKYKIKTANEVAEINFTGIDAIIISTPPDKHTEYGKLAIDHNIPAFLEASVILYEVEEIKKYNSNNTFIAPSCTLQFHPIIRDIKKIIKSGLYGKLTNFSYHSGQFLPDWHPWEKVNEFYVSNRITGGAREIVPFELTWIVDVIGFPKQIKGYFNKTINFNVNIEDSYAFVLKYDTMVGTVLVDVAARYAIRNLLINLEEGQIQWKWDENCFNLYDSKSMQWVRSSHPINTNIPGYNKNIGEGMYIEEIKAFITGIQDRSAYPNSVDDDIKILKLLNEIENSDGGF